MVTSQDEIRAGLKDAARWWSNRLRSAPTTSRRARLKAVQKFGPGLRNIDTAACAARGVKVLTIRRRANVACAEHAFALMLALSRARPGSAAWSHRQRIEALGAPCGRSTAATPRAAIIRASRGSRAPRSTLGIIGLGEIGREIALRAKGFGMRTLYHQRSRAPEAEERELTSTYAPLERCWRRATGSCRRCRPRHRPAI